MIDIEKVFSDNVDHLIGTGDFDAIKHLIIAQAKVEFCERLRGRLHGKCLFCQHQRQLISNYVTQIEKMQTLPDIDRQFSIWNAHAIYDIPDPKQAMYN